MTIENPITAVLHQVFSVTATGEEHVYSVDVDITDMNGERYRCKYTSAPDDTFGLAPVVRQWLIDNKGLYEIAPYVPPTIDDIRAGMTPITPRQLRLALVRSGISLLSVTAALDSLPEGAEKEEAEIEWEYATRYERMAPALLTIAGAIGLTQSEIDTLWAQALAI